MSSYCGLGKTQRSCLLGAFVLAGEMDMGTEGRIATSLTCVVPAPGSVRHMADSRAVKLTRHTVNEGMGTSLKEAHGSFRVLPLYKYLWLTF